MPSPRLLWRAADPFDELAELTVFRVSPDGQWLLVADAVDYGINGGRSFLVPTDSGRDFRELGPRDEFRDCTDGHFTADSRYLVLASGGDSQVARWQVWDLQIMKPVWQVHAPYVQWLRARVTAENRALIAEEIQHLDEVVVDQRRVIGAIDRHATLLVGASSPSVDSQVLDEQQMNRQLYLWRRDDPSPVHQVELDSPATDLAISHDGQRVALLTADHRLEVREIPSLTRVNWPLDRLANRPIRVQATRNEGDFVIELERGRLLQLSSSSRQWSKIGDFEGAVHDIQVGPDNEVRVLLQKPDQVVVHNVTDTRLPPCPLVTNADGLSACALDPSGGGVAFVVKGEIHWQAIRG